MSYHLKRTVALILILLLVAAPVIGASAQSAYIINSAVKLQMGDNTLTLDTSAVTTIYKFTPSEVGIFTFTASDPNALVGYWGAGSFFVSDQTVDKSSTLEVSHKNVGPSIMVGISGVESCTLTITREDDASIVVEPEWEDYENVANVTQFTLPTTVSLSPVNVTNKTINTAVMGSDGYYHLDSADGPLLIADLGHATMSLKAMQSYGQIKRYYYDEDGNVIQKLNFYNAMEEYFAAADGTMHPVTEDIKKVLIDMGEVKGWYDPNVYGGFYMFEGYTVDPAEAWMFVCYSMRECPIAHIEAVEPGCHYNGNIEYWYCSKCGDYWTDAACTQVTNSKNVILPAYGSDLIQHVEAAEPVCHQFGNVEYWYCPECDSYFLDSAFTVISNRLSVRLPAENELTYVSGVPATYEADGMQEYWYCADCDAVFADAAGTQLTNRENLVVPALSGIQILAHPATVTAAVGETVTFTVVAEGNSLTYKWEYSQNGLGWFSSSSSFLGYNTNAMSVPVTAIRNGFQYRCVITAADGTREISGAAVLNVEPPALQITAQPESQTAVAGDSVVFRVTASGEDLVYRWQYSKNGIGWFNSSSTFVGNNTAAMTVPATLARNGFRYRCIVTNASGYKVISDAALLTVEEAAEVTILTHPNDQAIIAGKDAVFTVSASDPNVTYRWVYSKNGIGWFTCTAFDGKDSDTLTVPATIARNGFYYRCVITTADGKQLTSNVAVLTVQPKAPVTILTQPTDQSVAVGDSAVFTVSVSESNVTYRWQYSKNGTGWFDCTVFEGKASDTLIVPGTNVRNGFYYRCVIVTEDGDKLISDVAQLNVG